MINPEEDGATHINIYSKGKTEIGKWLSNFTHSPVVIDGVTFNSLEAYWVYLCTDNLAVAPLSGYLAKKFGQDHTRVKEIGQEKIKKAIDIKLKTYLDKAKELSQTILPLEHYYVYGGKVKDAGYKWIIEHIELRRKQLKEYYNKDTNAT